MWRAAVLGYYRKAVNNLTRSLFLVSIALATHAQEPAATLLYKTVGDVKLSLHVYRPLDWKATDKRAAIVLFFGGGWANGSWVQFREQMIALSGRGMVAIAADYRIKSLHHTTPYESVADAKSAMRWVRGHAGELGVDPERIAAGGGSAGGQLAAAAALVEACDEPGESLKISSKPSALVLFNPALDVTPTGVGYALFGERAAQVSPMQLVKASAPPTIIFHGLADTTVPYENSQRFCDLMKAKGNRCELIGYEGQTHGFFNANRSGGEYMRKTLAEADRFLTGLGYLPRL